MKMIFALQKFNPRRGLTAILLMAMIQAGCSNLPSTQGVSASCEVSENLLADAAFTFAETDGQSWSYSQHTGPRSFEVTSTNGVAKLERTGQEPWMLLKQTIQNDRLAGATLLYSAELRGEGLSGNFGFDPKAGLYARMGTGGRATSAEHDPNTGDWEWQLFSKRIVLPEAVDRLQVGVVHQTGGVLSVRNPQLVLENCDQS